MKNVNLPFKNPANSVQKAANNGWVALEDLAAEREVYLMERRAHLIDVKVLQQVSHRRQAQEKKVFRPVWAVGAFLIVAILGAVTKLEFLGWVSAAAGLLSVTWFAVETVKHARIGKNRKPYQLEVISDELEGFLGKEPAHWFNSQAILDAGLGVWLAENLSPQAQETASKLAKEYDGTLKELIETAQHLES